MGIKAQETAIPGVVVLTPDCFPDDRGFFMESYNRRAYESAGLCMEFVQDNHSRSSLNVLRGLHYQDRTAPMAKLVRCTRGRIMDVAVDLRIDEPTFGKWVAVELSEDNFRQLFIPIGFAHGFLALGDETDVEYKASGYYSPTAERTIRWDDPELSILWGIDEPVVSQKDRAGMSLAEYRANPGFNPVDGATD